MNNQNDLNNIINTNNRFINANNNQPVNNNENTTQHSSMLSSTPNNNPNNNPNNLDNLVEDKPTIDTSHLDMHPQIDNRNDFILSSKSMEAMSENIHPMDEGLAFDKKAFIILVIILLLFIYFMPFISNFIENMDW